ncbi:MAG: hypothetical protein JO251_05685 [Verrucomicrobia bacterium]|nr:hypothetical protein [Verrucomicrobiota bacterium]
MRTDIDQLSYVEKLAVLTKLYLELRLALPDAQRAAEADLLGVPVSVRVSVPVTFSPASHPQFGLRHLLKVFGSVYRSSMLRVGTPSPLALTLSLSLTLSVISATIDICGSQPRTADLVTNLFRGR